MNKKRAIFLDRDGTINVEVDHLHKLDQLRLLPKAGQAIRNFNLIGFPVIIITSQSAVARGLLDLKGLDEIHFHLQNRLSRQGAKIDAIYFCPHHPEFGPPEFKIICDCRKPAIGMLKRAAHDFDLDLKSSFVIGDTTRDIQMGKNAGAQTILVQTGFGGKDQKFPVEPDYIAKNLWAASLLLKEKFAEY
jgi:histidinol-phosphate phosphatase family protein